MCLLFSQNKRVQEIARLPYRLPHDHPFVSVLGVGVHNEKGRRLTNEDDEIIIDRFCGRDDMVGLSILMPGAHYL